MENFFAELSKYELDNQTIYSLRLTSKLFKRLTDKCIGVPSYCGNKFIEYFDKEVLIRRARIALYNENLQLYNRILSKFRFLWLELVETCDGDKVLELLDVSGLHCKSLKIVHRTPIDTFLKKIQNKIIVTLVRLEERKIEIPRPPAREIKRLNKALDKRLRKLDFILK